MPRVLNIEIAGIVFAISTAAENIRVTPPQEPAYQEFIHSETTAKVDIQVVVSTEPAASVHANDQRRLFDGGQAWSLFQTTDGYRLTLNPIENEPPLWTISVNSDFTELQAHCHPSLVRSEGKHHIISCPITYPLDQVILIHYFARRKGLIVHCAGLETGGHGFIFPGRSGAGKSTVSHNLAAADGINIFSDDRMIIRQADKRFTAHGTPWAGEAKIAENRTAPLESIFFLARADSHRIKSLSPDKALKRLLPVASIPWYDAEILPGILDCCGNLVERVPAYHLEFALDDRLVEVLANFFP